jgi:CheY-like chemotaxis protein
MARVLVVDDDPWTQRMVSSVLTHKGHAVDLAADGWEALITAGRNRPAVVIVDVQLPTTDGWTLVATLRSRPDLGEVPALFLTTFTDEDTRGASFRPVSDDTMAKPFRLEELLAKVEVMLARAGAAAPAPQPRIEVSVPSAPRPGFGRAVRATPPDALLATRSALTGRIEQFGLASVLVLFDLERKSGVAIVTGAAGRGRIFVRDGRVVRAAIEGREADTGAQAVYELLTWTEGRFEFQPGQVEGDDEIRTSTSFLLLEGARIQDESRDRAKRGN